MKSALHIGRFLQLSRFNVPDFWKEKIFAKSNSLRLHPLPGLGHLGSGGKASKCGNHGSLVKRKNVHLISNFNYLVAAFQSLASVTYPVPPKNKIINVSSMASHFIPVTLNSHTNAHTGTVVQNLSNVPKTPEGFPSPSLVRCPRALCS